MWNTELWGKRYKKSGRIGRLDYFKSQLFLFAIFSGLFLLSILTFSKVLFFITFIYICAYLWLSFCLMAKRLHDIGLSSWTLLVLLILTFRFTFVSGSDVHIYSLLGFIFGNAAGYVQLALFVAFIALLYGVKGTRTDNKYGKTLRGET